MFSVKEVSGLIVSVFAHVTLAQHHAFAEVHFYGVDADFHALGNFRLGEAIHSAQNKGLLTALGQID